MVIDLLIEGNEIEIERDRERERGMKLKPGQQCAHISLSKQKRKSSIPDGRLPTLSEGRGVDVQFIALFSTFDRLARPHSQRKDGQVTEEMLILSSGVDTSR